MPKTKDIDPDVLKLLGDPKGATMKKFIKHCLDELIEEADEERKKKGEEKKLGWFDDFGL